MRKYVIILGIVPLLTGCFKAELEFEDQFEPVVEAYLYVSQDVDDIKLSSMISFGADSLGGEAITDAQVFLQGEGDSWVLVHDDSDPGNYYMDEQAALVPGDSFLLQIEVNEESLNAVTVIPEAPPAVSLSSTSVYFPKVDDMRDLQNVDMPDPVELTWDNPEAKYYFLNIQNIESYPMSIKPDPPADRPGLPEGVSFQMITEPTNDNYASIDVMRDLEYFGTHMIIFTSVNEEYVYLYNSLNQDSRELNEPYTNIENGLGIFTAFNSDTIYLEVVPNYL